MNALRSIRTKIVLIILGVTFIALSSGLTLEAFRHVQTKKALAFNAANDLSRLQAEFLTGPLAFGDRKGAVEMLALLYRTHDFKYAVLKDKNGAVFATMPSFPPDNWKEIADEIHESGFTPNALVIKTPLTQNNNQYGSLTVLFSTSALKVDINEYLFNVTLTMVSTLILAIMLAWWLANYLSRPIMELTELNKTIAQNKDFSVRSNYRSRDEIGYLARSFDQLLEQVEIQQSALEKSVDKLEQSNTELAQFAYAASHDLQEPLRMVVSFSKMLKSGYNDKIDDAGREYVDIIVEAGKRMRHLISDLLEYARLEQESTRYQTIDCQAELDWVLSNLSTALTEAKAQINISGTLPQVTGNPIRFRSIMQNLIGNATKYREADKPLKLNIEISESADFWTFSVNDNGIGIRGEYLTDIMQPFKRLHTNDEFQGTGMGLAICNRIVNAMGGKLWVTSRPSQGSTFYFTMPKPQAKTG